MRRIALALPFALAICWPPQARPETAASFDNVQSVLKTYCFTCHSGSRAAGKIDFSQFHTADSLVAARDTWSKALARVRASEMPPKGSPTPNIDEREKFVSFVDGVLRQSACAQGLVPGPAIMHRLNRDEYTATIRDLLNIQIAAGHALPADGAGGEGFDNAAETLFLSPIHAEKYLQAAKDALDYAFKDTVARETFLIAMPSKTVNPEQAAHKILEAFLPRAFRHPVTTAEPLRYLALFKDAQSRKETFDESIKYALEGVLVSPQFLFRSERPNTDAGPRLLNDYEIASRLSYFLWGTMPDQVLFDLAKQGKLQDPAVLKEQVTRLLYGGTARKDDDKVRIISDAKVTEFATRFVEQWLGTRELGRDIKPDPKLFAPYYDSELQAAIRYEPILFFQELLASNLSLLNLIDSKFTFVNDVLSRFYGLKLTRLGQSPVKRDLPEGSHRGGLLGMSAVSVVSSYSYRTSPVLRGKWVLEALLGSPPPPPPPNVPKLDEPQDAAAAMTFRERLTQHRKNPECGVCHNRIDPIGFGLENYDVLGRWRTEDAGKPLDTKGELPDGTTFDGPEQLKASLLAKKDQFIRHLTSKMLGYALGRGLTIEDSCTVDQIMADLEKNDYKAHTLIQGIVLSVPFRYQPGTNVRTSVADGSKKETSSDQKIPNLP